MLAATRRGPTPCWLHQVCSRTRQHARAHSLPFFPSFPTHADPYLTPLSPMLFAVPCPCPSATRLCCEGRRLLPSLVSPSPWGVAQATRRSGPCRPRRRAHHHPCHHGTYRPVAVLRCTPTAASARLRAVCDSVADCSLVAWRAPAPNPNPIHTFDLYGSRQPVRPLHYINRVLTAHNLGRRPRSSN